jgi:hypothetical protein
MVSVVLADKRCTHSQNVRSLCGIMLVWEKKACESIHNEAWFSQCMAKGTFRIYETIACIIARRYLGFFVIPTGCEKR